MSKNNNFTRIIISLVLFMTAFCNLSAADGGEVMRWGLFIGANNGGRGLDQLLYADDDALSIAATLTELGGISSMNAEILIDPKPEEILTALDDLALIFNRQDPTTQKEFIFYYSGHSDDEGMILGNRKVLYSDVKAKLNALNTDVTVAVLDSCSSGAFTRAKGGVHRAPFMLDDSVQTEGHAYLTSSSASEISQESDLIGGSFFTYFLIAGLRGAADANGDGRVTLNEVYQHTYSETISRTLETGGVQHPTYEINLSGSGDLVMTDLSQPTSVLILDKTMEGQLFIKNSEGILVLEMNKPLGQLMPLALPAGEYTVQVVHSTGISKSAPVMLLENESLTLTPMDLTPMGLELTRSRGELPVDDLGEDVIRIQSDEGYILISRAGIEIVSFEDGESIQVDKDLLGEDFLDDEEIFADDLFDDGKESLFLRNLEMKKNRLVIPFGLTFVPGLATVDLRDKEVNCELGFIASAATVSGVQLGYIGAHSYDYSNAVQAAGIYTIANKSLAGAQFSGVYSYINGELEGIQSAGIIGIVKGDTSGIQANGLVGTCGGAFDGVQANGLVSYTKGSFDGVQASGIVNVAGGVNGVQAAGLVNIAKGDMDGVQASGIFNYARGDASGLQIGLINMANSLDGIPIGLLNLYHEGITTIGYWSEIEGDNRVYYSMMTGNDWAYTHFFVGGKGYDFWNDWNSASYGMGLGVRIPVMLGLHMDLDINQKTDFILNYDGVNMDNPTDSQAEDFMRNNWGDTMTLLGRAVLTTDWALQPYWGYTAELKKASLMADDKWTYYPDDREWNGYGISYQMIFGVRMDFF